MADRIKLVQGDTKPQLQFTLTDENTGLPVDITGATPRLKFRATGTTGTLATLTATVTNGPAGQCVVVWGSTTLDVPEGYYEGELEVVFSDGSIQTVYDIVKFKVRSDFA